MNWIPCSGLQSIEGLVWLPRLLEKARRCEGDRASGRLVEGYCYGDNDFIDKQLLKFLRTDDATVSALVRSEPDDAAVAKILVHRSGHTPDECRAFSKKMRRLSFDFALLEADEGRMAPGLKRTIISGFYNGIMMPVVYSMFRRDELKRQA